ncbi:MAG TPA: DUF1638 domain-containing protein [Dehalococcoidia bacterium]|nr:DUF1638 domain-containing protein [Dehalococcoidia bacterium]
MGNSLPLYRPLTPKDVQHIDQAGRRILERIGISIYDSKFLDILKAAGAQVDYDNQRVRFPGDWLDEALGKAPSRFTLYSRDGRNDLHLGEGNVYFTNGGRVFRILDMGTSNYRYTMIRHVARTAALVEHLEHIRLYIIACQAHALEPQIYHLNDFFHAFNHTTKHVMGGCDNLAGAEQVWELASFIAGGEGKLKKKPFVSVITNMISPLTIETKALNILDFCTKHGIPTTCAPAPIAGATSPATLAGTLAQMHAEALAGVALTQVFAPGAKVLYGAVPTIMDLRKMDFTMGSVEMAMMNAAAVQLAKLYNLPIYASAGVTEAKRPDIQAGFEKTFSDLLVAMAGADFVHLAAGMLDSGNTISYEQYVIDNEIIGMVQRILAGIKVNKGTLGLDIIEKVGPGGNYVTEDHTVEHMMDEFFYPALSVRLNFDIWEERGRPSILSRAKDKAQEILKDSKEGLLEPDLVAEIEKAFPAIQMSITKSPTRAKQATRIIACMVFKPVLDHLQLEKRYRNLRITYLPANLHMNPQKLKNYLLKQIAAAEKRNERIICLYGDCFPDIDDFCEQHGAMKAPGTHCYEMLLGSDQFKQLTEETAGTYFLEKELILNFDEFCIQPLELYDEEMRKYCFEHYKRLLYVRQPSDPDVTPQTKELVEFLELPLEIRNADYSDLERKLIKLIEPRLL